MQFEPYLETSEFIDWKHPDVINKAQQLSHGLATENHIIKACFDFVRDEIKHSNEYKLNPITCKASEVLKHKTGYCYAKSHLLAALLRANKIPTALCYQRLSIDDKGAPFCLHGLNAVYLKQTGWYRIDARGNNDKVNAQFTPPIEQLAFPITIEGEFDIPEIYTKPLKSVVNTLTTYKTYDAVAQHLPDVSPN
ncbi:MAG: transglutaminase family protein [Gammaproteobacteria bacterium]|nr:transglutaminase family protein [Gammaproteobacteria bacterium]